MSERFVVKLPDEYLLCRRYGHSWVGGEHVRFTAGTLKGEVITCRSCKTDRVEVRNTRGALQWRWYDHPRDYHKPRDQVRTNVEELTHEVLKRSGGLNDKGWGQPIPDNVKGAIKRRRTPLVKRKRKARST